MAASACCSMAVTTLDAAPLEESVVAAQQEQSAPKRKGWNNVDNPLYGNVAKVTHIKKSVYDGEVMTYHHTIYSFNAAGDMVRERYIADEWGGPTDAIGCYEYYDSGLTRKYTLLDLSGNVLEEYEMEEDLSMLEERFPAAEVAGKTIEEPLNDDFGSSMGTELRKFDASGRLLYYKQTSNELGVLQEYRRSYDAKGRMVEYELLADLLAIEAENGYTKEVYSYNAQGRISKVLYYFVKGGVVSQHAIYSYDAKGNLVKITRYEGLSKKVVSSEEYKIEYR